VGDLYFCRDAGGGFGIYCAVSAAKATVLKERLRAVFLKMPYILLTQRVLCLVFFGRVLRLPAVGCRGARAWRGRQSVAPGRVPSPGGGWFERWGSRRFAAAG